jgi:hypothetical protein
MDLSAAEVGYFIQQVAESAASFGVAKEDLTVVGTALNSLFNVRCAPPTVVIPSQPAELQSICIDDTCALSPNATCSSYNATMEPAVVNSTMSGNGTSGNGTSGMGSSSTATGGASKTSGMSSATSSGPATVSKAAAATFGMSFAAVAGGLFAAFL